MLFFLFLLILLLTLPYVITIINLTKGIMCFLRISGRHRASVMPAWLYTFFFIYVSLVLVSCSEKEHKYVIGVSQCSQDIWREKLNAELTMGTYFHDNVELRFASADDSDEKQIKQINQFLDEGIDLLIVAPNQVATVTPTIDKVFDKGIPVIVFDRKTDSQKYTASIGADNYEMGHQMGEYIATELKGKGKVIEIMGLKGSSPAIERHEGFLNAIESYPGIQVVASLQGDWTEESAVNALKDFSYDYSQIDFVFGQNDRMAVGASKVIGKNKNAKAQYCGIDGLPGEGGGIECVRDSILKASYIYPTHGDEVLQLAVNILEGKPFKKENPLKAALVTKDNAKVLLLQSEEMKKQEEYLDQLHNRADGYLQQLDSQRLIMFLAVGAIVLLLLLLVFIYIYYLQKARMNEEREKMTRDQLDFYTQVSHELRTPLTLIEGPLEQLGATDEMEHASLQTSGLFSIVRRNTSQLTQLINKMLDMQTSNGVVSLQSSSADDMAETHLVETLKEDVTSDNSDTSKTILVVDDNADIRAYLSTILQDRYQIALAADGSQGLALANEIVPDLIVSDVMMPVMNGLEFCQRIKSGIATSHIPVILLTARALSQHQVEGYESGADAYITKPFSPEVLLARITNLLHSRYQLKNLFTATNDTKDVGQPTDSAETTSSETKENTFIQKFRQFVEENMSDSGLNVETIGAELGLSRVQLYRKVKALTGVSPVELVRTVRLQRGRELLQTTDKTVSEVAYEVGFSAPSYFTKCFKDEFGVGPSEMLGGAEANS